MPRQQAEVPLEKEKLCYKKSRLPVWAEREWAGLVAGTLGLG